MNNAIPLLLRQLGLALEQQGRTRLKGLGLSISQGLALDYLFSRPGQKIYAIELHKASGLSKAAISSTLKELKKAGYLEMFSDPEDDRRKQLVLTPKAYALKEQLNQELEAQQKRLCRTISPRQLEITETSLHTMLCNLKDETSRKTACGTVHPENTHPKEAIQS